jgi:hypothetical protein
MGKRGLNDLVNWLAEDYLGMARRGRLVVGEAPLIQDREATLRPRRVNRRKCRGYRETPRPRREGGIRRTRTNVFPQADGALHVQKSGEERVARDPSLGRERSPLAYKGHGVRDHLIATVARAMIFG